MLLWHVPSLFYLPTYRQVPVVFFPGFALSVVAGAVVFTWLFNSSRGSVLAVALWHGTFNFVSASKASAGAVSAVVSVLVIVWAMLLVWLLGAAHLSRAEKQVR